MGARPGRNEPIKNFKSQKSNRGIANMLDEATQRCFEDALATNKLEELGIKMTSEGLSQVAIYHLFELFRQFLRDAKRESDEETLMDSMDCLVGFCSRSNRWFDHDLTNEEIEEYRKAIGQS